MTCWMSFKPEIWTRTTTTLMRIVCRPHKSRPTYDASQLVWWISGSVLFVDPADWCVPKLGRMRFRSLQRSIWRHWRLGRQNGLPTWSTSRDFVWKGLIWLSSAVKTTGEYTLTGDVSPDPCHTTITISWPRKSQVTWPRKSRAAAQCGELV